MIRRLLLLLIIITAANAIPANEYIVSGIISNPKPARAIYLALYRNQYELDHQVPFMKWRFRVDLVTGDTLRYIFKKVPEGDYIVTCYQDINNNGAFDKTAGLPAEPYRMYKPYRSLFPPSFKALKFRVDKDIVGANLRF